MNTAVSTPHGITGIKKHFTTIRSYYQCPLLIINGANGIRLTWHKANIAAFQTEKTNCALKCLLFRDNPWRTSDSIIFKQN